jgi:hypothetical protein
MGTRSLLAVETKKGKAHVQYMQFDGYPSVKGYEYYSAVLFALIEGGIENFCTKDGKPNKHFRERCVNFLNNYQYATHHSTGNHFECNIEDEWHFQKDCWQEFEYMFFMDGTFHMDGWGLTYEIPWEVTKAIAGGFYSPHELNIGENRLDDGAVNILSQLFAQLDEREDDNGDDIQPLIMEVEQGELHAFPDQNKNGWRKYAVVKLKSGNKIALKVQSSMANRRGKKRGVEKHKCFGERG